MHKLFVCTLLFSSSIEFHMFSLLLSLFIYTNKMICMCVTFWVNESHRWKAITTTAAAIATSLQMSWLQLFMHMSISLSKLRFNSDTFPVCVRVYPCMNVCVCDCFFHFFLFFTLIELFHSLSNIAHYKQQKRFKEIIWKKIPCYFGIDCKQTQAKSHRHT